MSSRRSTRKRRFPILSFGIIVALLVVIGLAAFQISQKLQIVVVQSDDRVQLPTAQSQERPPQDSPAEQDKPIAVATSPLSEADPAEPSLAETDPEPTANMISDVAGETDPSLPNDETDSKTLETIANASSEAAILADEQSHNPSQEPDPSVRTWTDSRGRFTVEAKLIEQTGRSVTLERLDNGKQVTILIRRLSKADREFLKSQVVEPTDRPTEPAAPPPADPSNNAIIARVIRVSDGDTIDVADRNGNEQRIRFNGIDAPEYTQRFGREVRGWLAKQIDGKAVKLELVEKDRYDRWTANIFLDDAWINLELVQRGYAWHYHRYSDDARLAAAHRQAQANRLGIWQDNDPLPPWRYRELNREQSEQNASPKN